MNPKVFYGLLHDCSSTHTTDQCQEPQPDRDKWVQFCFKYNQTLGNKRIFIEFMINWDELFGDDKAKYAGELVLARWWNPNNWLAGSEGHRFLMSISQAYEHLPQSAPDY
jgi:hypothetical protein